MDMRWQNIALLDGSCDSHGQLPHPMSAPVCGTCARRQKLWAAKKALQRLCQRKHEVKSKGISYIAQYPVLRTAQSALHFTSLTDLFTHTPSRLLWEASSHMLQLMREGCSYTHPPLYVARYSFIQLSELEQCRVNKTCPRF